MKAILGSGVVGLLARHILGPEWKIIPFHRSRFFSFDPALDDNFIVADPEIEPFVNELTKDIVARTFPYTCAWSIGGEIIRGFDSGLCYDWLYKVFDGKAPPHATPYLSSHMNFNVYDVRINKLYQNLVSQYMPEIMAEQEKGIPTHIGPHTITRNGVTEDYTRLISTIPLPTLCDLIKVPIDLPSRTVHYIHLQTEDLNFEGVNQQWVVDNIFDFYKVTNIAPNRYLFYFHNDIPNPGVYLMSMIRKFEIIDGTSIVGAIPQGPSPKLENLEAIGITCLGSYAQWDWCMDIGSCIKRLLRMVGRNMKASQPTAIDLPPHG